MLFEQMLKKTLRTHGAKAEQQQLHNFLDFVERVCPWFPEEGTVNLAVAYCVMLIWASKIVCTRIHM